MSEEEYPSPHTLRDDALIELAFTMTRVKLGNERGFRADRDGGMNDEHLIEVGTGHHRSPAFEAAKILKCQWAAKSSDWICARVERYVSRFSGTIELDIPVTYEDFISDLAVVWGKSCVPPEPYKIATGARIKPIDPGSLWPHHETAARFISCVLTLTRLIAPKFRILVIHQAPIAVGMGVAKRTVANMFAGAIRKGWIRIIRHHIPKRSSRVYQVVVPVKCHRGRMLHPGYFLPLPSRGSKVYNTYRLDF